MLYQRSSQLFAEAEKVIPGGVKVLKEPIYMMKMETD